MMFRVVFWDILSCKMIVDRRFRGAYCLHHHGSISQKTTLTKKINWLTVFKEILAVYSENHARPANTKYRVVDFYDILKY
jgi:hypothetical protein